MKRDLWIIAFTLVISLVIGAQFNAVWLTLSLAALGLLAWQLHRIRRLERWVDTPRASTIPVNGGWVYELMRKLNRREKKSRDRQRQLTGFLDQIRKAIGALPDAIVLIDQDGKIEWANNNALTLLGVRWPADSGLRFTDLVRYPALESMLSSNEPFSHGVEVSSSRTRGAVLNIKCLPYTQALSMIVARDVTRLVHAGQMQRDFVANVSHELKTPLTVLRGYIEILIDQAALPKRFMTPLEQMNIQTLRMDLIVADLLHLARLESSDQAFEDEWVDMGHLVNTAVEAVQPLMEEKNHSLSLSIDPALKIEGASQELHSVLSNLLTNAIHYTPENGELSIYWGRDESVARLIVRDNGPGIAQPHLERLTQRFYRVDTNRSRESGGTGLGLAIVKHVLQRHGARLLIQSELGEGSAFICEFDAKQTMQNPAAKSA